MTCQNDFRLVDQSITEHSVVELYVCFNCGAERFRALSGRFCGVEATQLGSMEAERAASRSDRREDR